MIDIRDDEELKELKNLIAGQAGLSTLDALNVKQEFKVTKFNQISNNVKSYLKKAGLNTVPSNQTDYILKTMQRIYGNMNVKQSKREGWNDRQSKLWEEVEDWLSKEVADSWFEKFA